LVARNDDGTTKDMKLAIIGLDCAAPQSAFERFRDSRITANLERSE
jgi:hypothetical protein